MENEIPPAPLPPNLPYYSYMIVNNEPAQKISTWIDECRDPALALEIHNKGGFPSTKASAPHWKLKMVIGPFIIPSEASDFSVDWKSASRGIHSRVKRGISLAQTKNVRVYDENLNIMDGETEEDLLTPIETEEDLLKPPIT